MSTTPVPSLLPEDFLLNVRAIDEFCGSTDATLTNRLGVSLPTIHALISEFPSASSNAAIALEQAGIATAQAGISTSAAADSVAAKVAAEAARDSINTTGKVFTATEGTAAGILATTNQQQFAVLSSDLMSYGIWRNNAGVAQQLSAVYTKNWFDLQGVDTTYTARCEYAIAWLDSVLAMALGIRNDGRVIFGKGGDIAQRLDANDASIAALSLTVEQTDVASAIAALAASLPTQSDPSYSRSGYTIAWCDANGHVALGLDNAGDLISKGRNLTQGWLSMTQSAQIAVSAQYITPVGFWWYGDSLSASGAPALLTGYLGRTVTVGAVGGQIAQQIAARFGGMVPLFSVANNTIPASGAVNVTSRSIELITAQNAGATFTGKLFGIQGTYTSDGATTWTFTRSTTGDATVIDPNTPFLMDISDQRMFGTVVFWYGRNNVGTSTFNTDVKQAIADSVAQIKTADKRFVVLSVLNWPGETTGTGSWTAIETLNSELKKLYPRNYVDVLNLLRRSGDGSANDIADAASGIIPRSLRNSSSDGHLNNTTGNQIVAKRVFEFLTEKGWTA